MDFANLGNTAPLRDPSHLIGIPRSAGTSGQTGVRGPVGCIFGHLLNYVLSTEQSKHARIDGVDQYGAFISKTGSSQISVQNHCVGDNRRHRVKRRARKYSCLVGANDWFGGVPDVLCMNNSDKRRRECRRDEPRPGSGRNVSRRSFEYAGEPIELNPWSSVGHQLTRFARSE